MRVTESNNAIFYVEYYNLFSGFCPDLLVCKMVIQVPHYAAADTIIETFKYEDGEFNKSLLNVDLKNHLGRAGLRNRRITKIEELTADCKFIVYENK